MKVKIIISVVCLIVFFILLPQPDNTTETNKKNIAYNQNFMIKNVQFYDGHKRFENVDILVMDNKIINIDSNITPPLNIPELNGTGKTLLPGLIDAHTHAFQAHALSDALNFGVTTELDMFTTPQFAKPHQLNRKKQSNTTTADLFSATILATTPNGHGTQFGFDIPVLTNSSQADKFVTDRISQGADYIKAVYNSKKANRQSSPSISYSTLAALIQAAHRHNKMLVVHIDNLISAKEAITLGADGLVHSFLDKEVDDEFVQLMQTNKAFMIPTLTILSSATQQPTGLTLLNNAHNSPYVSTTQRQQLIANFSDLGIPTNSLNKALASVKRLSDANVTILAGSDAPNIGTTHGLSLHAELLLLTKAGLTNEQAIHSATGAAGKYFDIGQRGTLTINNLATMVLINGNPFTTISDTQRIARIWKNGTELERQRYDALGNAPVKLSAGAITSFEHTLERTEMGHGISETTDELLDGKSVVTLQLKQYPQKAFNQHYLNVSGKINSGFMFPWAGFSYILDKNSQQGVDLTAIKSLIFRVKGALNTKELTISLFQAGSLRPIDTEITITNKWQTITVTLSDIKGLTFKNIVDISFVVNQEIGPFEFMIDDIAFK